MNKRKIGDDYEEIAVQYLKEKGYQILERNYRIRTGEIDIIARDGRYLVFVEVKYRMGNGRGTALEAVDFRKQNVIFRTAQVYLCRKGMAADTPCRFDVVGITGAKIAHVEDAFGM